MTTFSKTDWASSEPELRQIRETVFMQEQHVTAEDEWDGNDATAIHYLASHYLTNQEEAAIGCARLLLQGKTGKIGRVAILPAWRRRHIATELLHFIINDARAMGLASLQLDAQTTVTSLYEKLGFAAYGSTFMDAGILHQGMELQLTC